MSISVHVQNEEQPQVFVDSFIYQVLPDCIGWTVIKSTILLKYSIHS